MKSETDPISEDEWLIRLVWEEWVRKDQSPIISPSAFVTSKNESDGISLFRLACLRNAGDALVPIATEKRSRYAIVLLPVRLLNELQLSVLPSPIATVPGHVVIPELNYDRHKANKAGLAPIKHRLALEASNHVLRRPLPSADSAEGEGG
jgi:hypothetical protein